MLLITWISCRPLRSSQICWVHKWINVRLSQSRYSNFMHWIFLVKNYRGGNQDIRVTGCRAHITSPHEHAKIHLSVEYFHWKQDEDWQKNSYTTKPIRNSHTEASRNGSKVIRSESAVRRGHTRGGWLHVLRDPPWGQSSLKHILGSQTVKSYTEGRGLLTGLKTNGYDIKDVRNVDSTHDNQVHACLLLKWRQGSRLRQLGSLNQFPWTPWWVFQPKPNSALAPPAPWYRSKEGQRLSQPRRMCNYRAWRQLRHGKHPNRAWAAITDIHKGQHEAQRLGWCSGRCWESLSICPSRHQASLRPFLMHSAANSTHF